MSCRQSRRSNEMDSVNCATAAAGPPANRPLRETGEVCFHALRSPPNVRRAGAEVTAKKSIVVACPYGIVAAEAMSEFKFACPVCGQHITADSSTSGGQIECPTCFQKIVVPQAPASAGHEVYSVGCPGGQTPPRLRRGRFPIGPPANLVPPHLPSGARCLARPACALPARPFSSSATGFSNPLAGQRRPAPTHSAVSQPPRSRSTPLIPSRRTSPGRWT